LGFAAVVVGNRSPVSSRPVTRKLLQQTPVQQFDSFLVPGTLPDRYRPTLYDFIAHEALSFYTAGEQVGAKPEEPFVLTADSPIFDPVDAFIDWSPDAPGDSDSPVLRAIRLYQELLRLHRGQEDPTAFIDLDLARLVYGKNVAAGENVAERYMAALDRFVGEWADHEVAAMALYRWALHRQQENQLVEAHALASRGRDTHPQSPGGRLCQNLVKEIEAPSADMSTERVWNQPWPDIQIRYRNLTHFHFRVVAWDWKNFLDRDRPRPEHLGDRERGELLSREAVLEWSTSLPATVEFQQRRQLVQAPQKLPPGFYFLLASADPEFGDQNNQVSFAPIWVSELALVVRPYQAMIEGFVLRAESGDPVPNAEVMAWHLDRQGQRIPRGPFRTDEQGFFRTSVQAGFGSLLLARHNGQELSTLQDIYDHASHETEAQALTVFFTDRALYRPGQTIQYKGICVRVDTRQDEYRTLSGQTVVVALRDPNGREIARTAHRCNDYGSFSGSFTAPREGVLGSMTLHAIEGPAGGTDVQVEEYKRPRFQVTLDAPEIAPRLHDTVPVSGRAESYTGAAIDGAEVRYRVVRQVRWPIWRHWFSSRHLPVIQEIQEIAHGVTRTDSRGHFTVEFTAKPDPQARMEDGIRFAFTLYADVTDGAGETRSVQRTVNIGFVALDAVVTAEPWQTAEKPVQLTVRTTSLDGSAQSAEGVVRIHRLQPPAQVQRGPLERLFVRWAPPATDDEDPDLSDPNQWELGELTWESGFTTDATGTAQLAATLAAGAYRVLLESQDRFGVVVEAQLPVQVVDPAADHLAIKIPHLLEAPKWSLEPGGEFMALWGTGYDRGRAFVEIEHRGKIIDRYWTPAGQTQAQIRYPVTESMRGGFTLHVTYVRENRAYIESRTVQVPWSNKHLDLRWERFTSKLGPAEKETWTAVITRKPGGTSETGNQPASGAATPEDPGSPSAEGVVAEMVATLYDASLDAFLPHGWTRTFGFFRHDFSRRHAGFANLNLSLQHLYGDWQLDRVDTHYSYRAFPPELLWRGYHFDTMTRYGLSPDSGGGVGGYALQMAESAVAARLTSPMAMGAPMAKLQSADGVMERFADDAGSEPQPPAIDLAQVTARRNLQETAFFFPQLLSDSNGVVRMTFAMPEALTTWRFMGFAHDQQLRSGFLEGQVITAKDLMVRPNPPRFLREGDEIEFAVQVFNQSPESQAGRVRLTFNEAFNDMPADAALGNTTPELAFEIPPEESRSFSWRIRVPDGMGFLTYKAVAATSGISDGEEGYLPVLSRRVLVTESMPLPIRGPATERFQFRKLLESDQSQTLQHQNLVVQMVSNPAWYAVLALPYLMEFPHECSEQTFNRLYANSLARFIANSDPRIARIFEQWRNTPALDSPLERNEELKSIALEETPWLRQAQSESQARRHLGLLFDENRLDYETERIFQQLAESQLPDGSWSWFPGGRPDQFITLYITTGFGRLRHLGVDVAVDPALRSLERLDQWMAERHRRILEHANPKEYVPQPLDALYLYGRSFFLDDQPIAPEHQAAVTFFLDQSRQHWVKVGQRQSQGHLALALNRFQAVLDTTDTTPMAIMRSLKERSVVDNELGRFWRDTEVSWWWYRAPIETQALMIEAFDEVMGDTEAVEDCQVWLLKQKQTQDWKTTKATADAVYALLLRGTDQLASDVLVEVRIGEHDITPQRGPAQAPSHGPSGRIAETTPVVEPGTGFYERRFAAAEIRPALGEITVTKRDAGVAWGGVHWQYLEDISRITPHEATPLRLAKRLYTRQNTPSGPVLEAVQGPVRVGDELIVRVELRVDRDMEYVHLKDQRGSGTEPTNVLSQYRYQDGLAYYESTRDTASHFFIDYLPKGVYVFEYGARVQHRGQYQTGVATIQCLYAPEFNSHSASVLLDVRGE
jgi:hypothetical protein